MSEPVTPLMMRMLLLAALAALSLTACGDMRFADTMPPHTSELTQIPEACQGTFVTEDGETLVATATHVDMGDLQLDLVKGSDAFTVKAGNRWYYANLKDDDGRFYVIPFRPMENGNVEIGLFLMEEEGQEAALVNITPIVEEANGSLGVPVIAPNAPEFEALMQSDLLRKTVLTRTPK